MFGLCHIQVKNEVPLERGFNEKSNQDFLRFQRKRSHPIISYICSHKTYSIIQIITNGQNNIWSWMDAQAQ